MEGLSSLKPCLQAAQECVIHNRATSSSQMEVTAVTSMFPDQVFLVSSVSD
jgi:hypothetical protein